MAATLIVRDEARSIARCIASVRPWVDRVVVVDTGSTDGTAEIAARAGAEVHTFQWCEDFSAARNHALACADADWHLVIDADEWLQSGGEALRRFVAGPQRLGTICIDSSFTAGGEAGSGRSWITRLLPRGARYQGRIHEQVVSPLERRRIDVVFGHDGYEDAQMGRKRTRNRTLLMLDLAERPDDPYLAFQLGREAEGRQDVAEACDWYARAADAPAGSGWLHELTTRRLQCLGRAGRLDAALALADDAIPRWPDSPDLFFVVGNLLLDRAISDPAQAIETWLPLATGAWERCLEIGERPDLEGSVAGRGSHLARRNLDMVRGQMAALAA
ncbi:glycosyltransferase family 2 protein [Sphingomonas sp. CA1-15]|uniref:Glycosyltransferase family 2 protein n=1 Tax=Sphingomonas immobilis TaxID=3063997 RepID=A0ABT8ZW86_9SPHN|nr:glycosyltransferase family 2 protein [Sphingomonas sp. CA1-15]